MNNLKDALKELTPGPPRRGINVRCSFRDQMLLGSLPKMAGTYNNYCRQSSLISTAPVWISGRSSGLLMALPEASVTPQLTVKMEGLAARSRISTGDMQQER